MNAGWGNGYVTDIGYEHGYYREQSPTQLMLACLLSGVAWDVPAEGAHYMELGAGQGVGALITAAANPSWRITAIDFNPAHVAGARALARAAGLDNVTFIEGDLAQFAAGEEAAALPEADIITAHGLWSWVAPAVQQGVVELVRRKLRAGGVLHLSYNALPGWQGMLAMQRLTREAGLRLAGRSDRQAQAGLQLVRELAEADAKGLSGDARLGPWLAELNAFSGIYLAHELMNAHWQPCWHGEVVAAMQPARVEWVGSAALIENFPELAMSAAQRAIYDRFEDPVARELIKDVCISRTLRHDIFVRGARRLTAAARDAALRELTLALVVPPERVQLEVQVSAGKAELSPEFYGPVVQMLAKGPVRVAELLRAPGAVATRENPAELAGLLVGTRQAAVVPRPGAPLSAACFRLGAALARRIAVTDNLNRSGALPSPMLGAGLPCSIADLFVAGRLLEGEVPADMTAWLSELAGTLSEEDQRRVADALARAREQTVPLMRMLGCLPP